MKKQDMISLQRPIDSGVTLRLMHDLSPDSDESAEEDDESLAVQRERFLISCLAQSAINNNNSISHVSQTTCDSFCDRTENITETFTKLEWKQNQFERINNHINEQHLTKVLERPLHNINLINNNFLQSPDDCESSDKENVCPSSQTASRTGPIPGTRAHRRPRKLPDIPKKNTSAASTPLKPRAEYNEKCLADELQEALVRSEHDLDLEHADGAARTPKAYPKYSRKFLEELSCVKFNSVSKNTRAYLGSDNMYLKEDSSNQTEQCDLKDRTRDIHDKSRDFQDRTRDHHDESPDFQEQPRVAAVACGGKRHRDGGDEPHRTNTCAAAARYSDLVVTHRGMHRFVPRHEDEIAIEIGDPIHVFSTDDDLWCEGVNMRTSQRGVFPSMYATDLGFLEEEEEENGCSKFFLRFLGSVEVNYHKGDEVLCQAINKVALSRRAVKSSLPPPVCNVEISQYGVRMFDKSRAGHEDMETFTHFFALKHITFCGHHPRNERYFGFITKHPSQYRYACHVFLGEKSTRSVTDAMGQAFKRFYQEYMAFTHPTEDIYME
ncbi:JNK-interacting protein 1-like [Mya arenaria]|uniref:JNK-interacting protein 1-like n=1 Tax=Mya arenaria TaxID=6604 RepID=UPI0022E6711B|nr:JNK-interacting protein 1-like [Mya arenaria]